MINGNEGSPSFNPVNQVADNIVMSSWVNENVRNYWTAWYIFLSNFAYTHNQTLSSHRYTIADTDFYKYSYMPANTPRHACIASVQYLSCLMHDPQVCNLSLCESVRPSVRGHLVKILLKHFIYCTILQEMTRLLSIHWIWHRIPIHLRSQRVVHITVSWLFKCERNTRWDAT